LLLIDEAELHTQLLKKEGVNVHVFFDARLE